MKNILIFLTVLFTSTLLIAQDDKPKDSDRKRDRGAPRGADFKGDRKFDRFKMMNDRFKKENPEKFAELEKLRKENPEEYRKQLRTLMQKKMGEHMKKGMGERHWLHVMKEKDPEKYEELMKMRESDPEAFRKKMVQEFSERFKKRPDQGDQCRKEIGEILKKYNSSSDDEKVSLKKQLREKLEESFENDLKKSIEMAEKLEVHLKEVKARIEAKEAKKDSLIDEKVEYLIKGKFHRDGDRKRGGDHKRDGDKEIKRE